VQVWYANGKHDFFQSTKLEEAYAMFNKWLADWLTVHVAIS
jgi:hypothetical protein